MLQAAKDREGWRAMTNSIKAAVRDLAKVGLVVLVLSLRLVTPSAAAPADDLMAAFSSGDYATLLRLSGPLAEQGNAGAQFNLGLMYEQGWGILQDYSAAVTWYRKAADQGNARAQVNLGAMYGNGRGVPQDYATQVTWVRKAADQGDAVAQRQLGYLYQNGQGVPQDSVQAHMWYNLAAAHTASETFERSIAMANRDSVAALMTLEQIAEAQRLAREWKPK
jgi:hypothetical protein